MKILCSIFIVALSLHAAGQRRHKAFAVHNKCIVPPNGIHLVENVYMEETEVMNALYLEYLHFLAQDSSTETLVRAYPDTNIFGGKHLRNFLKHQKEYYKTRGDKHIPLAPLAHDDEVHQPSVKHHWWNYFSYHGTKHHPVVGVSYEQAVKYCQWRSSFMTRYFNANLKKKNKYRDFRDKEIAFEYSLPSQEQWEMAAAGGLDPLQYPYGIDAIHGDSTKMFHVHFTGQELVAKDKYEPDQIVSHMPNRLGFYNMIGNVAEMIDQKGISKGGSFFHKASEGQIKKNIPYTRCERWLGFRCVCKVIVKNKPKP